MGSNVSLGRSKTGRASWVEVDEDRSVGRSVDVE